MIPRKDEGQTTRTQRIVAWVLTLVMIPTLFAFGIYGLATNWENILASVRYSRSMTYLTNRENPEFFEMTHARIQSLESALGEGIMFKDELGYGNAFFQKMLGKKVINAGSHQLYTFDNGQLYAITTTATLRDEAEEVVEFSRKIDGEIPFLFSYITPQFYEGGDVLPEGYAAVDTGEERAEEVLGIAREAGLETMDSREFFRDTPYSQNELYIKTDMHWQTLAGIEAAKLYAEKISELTGVELDTSKISMEQLETEFYPQKFLGEYGQQIGEMNAGLDDITLYWPRYETSFVRDSITNRGTESHTEGSFRDAIIHWDQMEGDPSVKAYAAYGLVERFEKIENLGEDCADLTVLIYRDSYTAPIGAFLSLLVKNVVMVDLRTVSDDAIDYVEKYDPDMVIVSYSRQMMEDHNYKM